MLVWRVMLLQDSFVRSKIKSILWVIILSLTLINGVFFFGKNTKATTYDFARWESENPKPTANTLLGTYVDENNSVWSAGWGGTIVKYDGTSWSQQFSGTGENLYGISGLNSGSIWAVGDNGTILHYNGVSWSSQASGTTESIRAVYALDESNVWAVGTAGKIIKYNGSVWAAQTSGVAVILRGVTAFDVNNAWAVGSSGTILKYTNGVWAAQSSGTTDTLRSIMPLALDNVWAVGGTTGLTGSVALHYSGSGWVSTVTGSTKNLYGVLALDQSNIYAVGDNGTILKYTDSWSAETSGTTNILYGISGNADNLWICGQNGTEIKLEGLSWTAVTTGVAKSLYGVSVLSTDSAWAVGAEGTIISYNGENWPAEESPVAVTLYAVNALDANNVWAVGNGGKIIKYNGSVWTEETNPDLGLNNLYAVNALDANNVWAVGSGGTILKYNGAVWSQDVNADINNLNSVVALSASDVWAVGDSGTILHFNGVTWTGQPDLTAEHLHSIYAIDSQNIWVCADAGKVYKFNGTDWSAVTTGITTNLYGISATDSNNVWVSGSDPYGKIYKYNGSAWTKQVSGNIPIFTGITAFDQNNVWAVGANGTIQRYYSPANATAQKMLLKLPGQNFSDGVGLFGAINAVTAGQDFSVTVYATDNDNNLDKSNASTIGLTTDNPNAINPATFRLTQNDTCVQDDRQAGDIECGIGTATINLRTAGDWRITATDTNGVLTPSQSGTIHVNPAAPHQIAFSNPPSTQSAGAAGLFTATLVDQYGNTTEAEENTEVNVTASGTGKFSLSPSGPWQSSLSFSIPTGQSANSFYYINYQTGASSVTATTAKYDSVSANLNITPGPINPAISGGTRLEISNNSTTVGNNLTATITLKDNAGNPVAGKNISFYSSRANESIVQPSLTDDQGQCVGTITSTKAESTTLYAKDVTDNVWLEEQRSLVFTPDKTSSIQLSVENIESEAGQPIGLTITLFDRYNNIATNSEDKIKFSATDPGSSISDSYSFLPSDAGSHRMELILRTAGAQTISAEDLNTGAKKSILMTVFHAGPAEKYSGINTKKDKVTIGKEEAQFSIKLFDQFKNPIASKILLKHDTQLGKIEGVAETGDDGATLLIYKPIKEGMDVVYAYDIATNFAIGNFHIEIVPELTMAQKVVKGMAQFAGTLVTAAAALGLLTLVANAIGSAPGSFHLITYFLSIGAETLNIKKRKKTWGRVFDSATGKGVDYVLIRLFDQETMKLAGTVVTDIKGEFHFEPQPGTYVLSIIKEGYIFPTSLFSKKALTRATVNPSQFSGYYVGQPVVVTEKSTNLNLNIPIDPYGGKIKLSLRIFVYAKNLFELLTVSSANIFMPLLVIGAILSIFSAVVLQTQTNYFVSLAYVMIATIYVGASIIKNRHCGNVYDSKTRKPVEGVAISIFDIEHKTLKESRITDKYGRFSIFAPAGNYFIKAGKDSYTFPTLDRTNAEKENQSTINLKEPSFITISIPAQKK